MPWAAGLVVCACPARAEPVQDIRNTIKSKATVGGRPFVKNIRMERPLT